MYIMSKIKILVLFLFLSNTLSAQKINNSSIDIQSNTQEVLKFMIENMLLKNNNKHLYIYEKLGGDSFGNNLSCRNEDTITKKIFDSLKLNVNTRLFKNLGIKNKIHFSKINAALKFTLIKTIKTNELRNKIIKFSNPIFFNNYNNCFISYEIGEFEFANLVLIKKNTKWTVAFIICEGLVLN